MFLSHIQAEMVPTGTPPTNQCLACVYMMFLLHIQAEIVIKQDLLPQTHAQYALCRMFLLHIKAEMASKGDLFPQIHTQHALYGMSLFTSRLKWCEH